MTFDALTVALELAAAMPAILSQIRPHDRTLCDQLSRAATGIALSVSEGRQRIGRDRLQLYRVAAGSAAEVETCLALAEALGYAKGAMLSEARALVGREQAMLWRLTHPRRR